VLKGFCRLFLIIFFAASTLSCGRDGARSDENNVRNGGTLRYDVFLPIGNLNPAEEQPLSGATAVFALLYSFLCVPNEHGELEPDLADSWTYDPATFSWTIHIRTDALFHNKRRVTSDDIKYSLEAGLKNARFSLFSKVDRITALTDTSIGLTLKEHDPRFLEKIWYVEIIPKPRPDDPINLDHPIGSGPFKFSYRKGETELGLEANPDFYFGRPRLDLVIFYYQSDPERSWANLLSGKTDIVHHLYPKDYEMIQKYQDRFYFNLRVVNRYALLLFNTHDPLLSDSKVRLGLSYAINKDYIVKTILRGFGVVSVGPMGVNSPYHDPGVEAVPYSPKEGLRLLQEAGWSYDKEGRYLQKEGKYLEFTVLVVDEHQMGRRIAQYLRISLNDLGVKVHLQSLPGDELVRRYWSNSEFQAVFTEFKGAYSDPEILQILWSPCYGGESVAGRFEHPEVTDLLNEAVHACDTNTKKECFYKLDSLLTRLQPGIFLFHRVALDVMSKRISIPFTFSLDYAQIHQLRLATIRSKSR